MNLDIVSIDRLVEVNNMPQVSNPIFFDAGLVPTPDGLLSYEMFGRYGSYDRRTVFGYMDLGRKFLHPTVYKALTAADRRLSKIIDGSETYVLGKDGKLVQDDEGETGLDFLVKNLRKIKFEDTGSHVRSERVGLIAALKDNELWVTKWLCVPAFYRDVNLAKAQQGQVSVGDLNQLYARILSIARAIARPAGAFSFVGHSTESQMQLALVEVYNSMVGDGGRLPKKTGIIHRGLLGKSIDYACRSVISAPRINADSPADAKIDFRNTGIPLSQVCVLFFPFMVKEISDFVSLNIGDRRFVTNRKTGERFAVKDPLSQFTLPDIKKMVSLYIKAKEHRFDVIKLRTDDGIVRPLDLFADDLARPFTLIDLLYICASKVVEGKHVYVTRYPIEHHQNIHATRVHILSTRKTKEQKIGSHLFPDYPEVFPDYPEEGSGFVDTVQMSNAYLEALGGDYDGDTVSLRAVYTKEANEEAARIMETPRNLLDASGKCTRRLRNEGVLSIYTLTA
jgi:hypothetical protein